MAPAHAHGEQSQTHSARSHPERWAWTFPGLLRVYPLQLRPLGHLLETCNFVILLLAVSLCEVVQNQNFHLACCGVATAAQKQILRHTEQVSTAHAEHKASQGIAKPSQMNL